MDTRKINLDLNILRVFVAVFDLRSVSAAGLELDLSQSGVSTALARLREHFGDVLFTKTATGMEPTARAREMIEPTRRILKSIQEDLLAPQGFDPKTSKREFVVSLTDIAEGIYLPTTIKLLAQLAPGVTLRSRLLPGRELEEAMANGEVDIAAGYYPDISSNQFYMRRIGMHSFTCIARSGHPFVKDALTQQQFEEIGQIVVELPGRSLEVFEHFLKINQMRRRVILRTRHFMSVPVIIAETDAIAVLPQAMGDFTRTQENIKQVKLPFMPPTFQVNMYWHRSMQSDPGNRWLRKLIIDQLPEIRGRRYARNGVTHPGDVPDGSDQDEPA